MNRRRAAVPAPAYRSILALLVTILAATGCTVERQDVGPYRIATVKGKLRRGMCQPRTELYAVDRSSPGADPVYLGTCGTPQFVTGHLGLPGNPSCFAVADDSAALVYFHRPNWCGAGARAREKTGGVYLHAVGRGDRLLYRAPEQVGPLWSRAAIDRDAIRVGWNGAEPSRGGAACGQRLVIHADGREEPEGNPSARCAGTPDTTDTRAP